MKMLYEKMDAKKLALRNYAQNCVNSSITLKN